MKETRQPIMIVAGEGGHTAQMLRLRELLEKSEQNVICVGEIDKSGIDLVCPLANSISVYSKKSSMLRYLVLAPLAIFLFVWSLYILLRFKPKGVVFLGPLFSVPFILSARLLRFKSLFIESWSRFEKASISGKFAEKLGIKILYQNKSMGELYNNGMYSGRL